MGNHLYSDSQNPESEGKSVISIFKKCVRFLVNVLDKIATDEILVLCDSHAIVFMHPISKILFPLVKYDVCSVGGATASGIENPNSKTQAYKIFREKLDGYLKYDKIIIMLGEVDTGFVIWYRAEKYGTSLSEMLKDATTKYTNFLHEINTDRKVFVISTPLPTISDDNNWGEVANLRKEIKASQIDRTKLTVNFNKNIETYCNEVGIEFINLDEDSIGDNGIVKNNLLNKNKLDHHYNKMEYIKLLYPKLKNIVK